MRRYIAAVVVAGAIGTAACDAGSDRPGTAADSTGMVLQNTDDVPDSAAAQGPITTGDGYAIVDEAAVEQAVGFDVVMNDNTTGNCVLTPASGDASAPAFDFRVEPRVSAFDYFSAQSDATPIDGLGDRAVWATLNEMTGYVVIVSGTRAIVTAVAKADGLVPSSRQQAERLARLILASN